MLVNACDHAVDLNRRAQVVIVGAGPVGLTLARELALVADVLVIEGGGFASRPDVDAQNAGQVIGLPYPLEDTRTRRVGGSLSLWAGWLAPFEAHDFESLPRVDRGSWPFGLESLETDYEKAALALNLRDLCFDARVLAAGRGLPLPLDDNMVTPSVWRFGTPTWRIGEPDRTEFASLRGWTILTQAHVVDLRLGKGHDRIQDLVVRTLNGREGTIAADLVVMACGGLETPRLLLNADGQVPTGLANSSGLVGRCFMEHPHFTLGSLQLRRPDWFAGSIEPQRDALGREFMLNFGLTPGIQQAAGILNGRLHVFRTPSMHPDEMPKAGVFMEQSPNPASRVTLGNSRDRLGIRQLVLDWQLSGNDWSSFRQTRDLFVEAFERIGAGRRILEPVGQGSQPEVLHSNHHLGTTRMSADPRDGVVNPDCRAHDLENLYLIGGNVFPTGSWANPTFTLIALTFRLARHLKAGLAS